MRFIPAMMDPILQPFTEQVRKSQAESAAD